MTTTLTWRPATPDDVGRLARFRDYEDEVWDYGVIAYASSVDYKDEYGYEWLFCEVQEVATTAPIQWHPREVTMTWPEGSVVAVRYPRHLTPGHWHSVHDISNALLQGKDCEFALLELPRAETTFTQ